MRPLLLLSAVPLTALLLTACGSDASDPSAGDDSLASGGISQADDDLSVRFDPGDGAPVEEWTLSCLGEPTGSHPQPEAACTHLQGLSEPFTPLPDDMVCTEQYGGPQTAQVTGVWDGEPVDLTLARTNGCYISQWDSLVPLVPAVS